MTTEETFHAFAAKFVNPEFRERFTHEARKRPEKLHYKICHQIDTIFDPKLAGGSPNYRKEDVCLLLRGSKGFELTTWAEAEQFMGMGNGILIIDRLGTKFYAETEAMLRHPAEVYAG